MCDAGSMSMGKPNLRAVAARAGVSPATASMALRRLARVPERTRSKVEAAAAELGYVRDPQIGQVLARSRCKAPPARETMVFLTETDVVGGVDPRTPWLAQFHRLARASAHRFGCELEAVTLPAQAGAQRRLGRVLWTRGVRGLLVGPITLRPAPEVDLDWGKFAAVELGSTLRSPVLRRVERDYYEDCLRLYGYLRSKGYRRIGLAIRQQRRAILRGVVDASLLYFCQQYPDVRAVVPLEDSDFDANGFRLWMERENPDVMIQYQSDNSLEIPAGTVRMPTAYLSAVEPQQTGLVADLEMMTHDAVSLLYQMLVSGEWGPPVRPSIHAYRNLFQIGSSA